ncbi:MAG: GNAT family N-acetyltransferase [Oscillospiraceae bacterium]|nr:GNAT family N-acetyltransferase [Oscillospiraceae bacterium]
MNHLGTKQIETDRLNLRPFVMQDADAMYRNWASDPEVTKFLSWPTYKSVDTAHEILEVWTNQYDDKTFYQWAIELKKLGQPIGSISVVNHDDNVEMAEIGFCIGKNWWGQGIMTEAFQAVIDFLFGVVGVQRIEAGHDPNNPASGAVQRKCGLKYEGTLRRSIRSNQGITDKVVLAILKEEWKR